MVSNIWQSRKIQRRWTRNTIWSRRKRKDTRWLEILRKRSNRSTRQSSNNKKYIYKTRWYNRNNSNKNLGWQQQWSTKETNKHKITTKRRRKQSWRTRNYIKCRSNRNRKNRNNKQNKWRKRRKWKTRWKQSRSMETYIYKCSKIQWQRRRNSIHSRWRSNRRKCKILRKISIRIRSNKYIQSTRR